VDDHHHHPEEHRPAVTVSYRPSIRSLAVIGAGNDKLRGRTEAGLSVQLPDGISFAGKGFYDGLGANDYDAYGGSVSMRVPF
jgi:hypothetical protein